VRDTALLALLSLQVLRTVEGPGAKVDDMWRRDEQWALLVRCSGHDPPIFLREDLPRQCTLTARRAVSALTRSACLCL
jgi:hypothetical protein